MAKINVCLKLVHVQVRVRVRVLRKILAYVYTCIRVHAVCEWVPGRTLVLGDSNLTA